MISLLYCITACILSSTGIGNVGSGGGLILFGLGIGLVCGVWRMEVAVVWCGWCWGDSMVVGGLVGGWCCRGGGEGWIEVGLELEWSVVEFVVLVW